jgi:hypothetical protein
VRYQISGQPLAIYVCHCLECRKQSASAFGISARVRRVDFSVVSGTPRFWSRKTDSGRMLDCAFCPECGSRVWHQRGGDPGEFVTVKGGSLDEAVDLSGAIHIWTSRKLPGVIIPDDAPQFPLEPM